NIIILTPSPILPFFTYTTLFRSICAGSSITFTATPTNGGTTPTYQWQVNGVNAGTNSPTFTSSSLANNDQVTVIMTSNASCTTTSTATSNIITITTSSVTPSVSINASSTSICAGSSITFTATPTNGGTTPTYQWQVNGVNVPGQVSSTFTSTSLSTGDIVTAIMTSNNSCTSPPAATSNGVTVSVTAPVPG